MKNRQNGLLRRIALFGIPAIVFVAVVVALITGKGTPSKAYNQELEEKLADGGKLAILEIVPDKCQQQFSWLVKGQEPLADLMYSANQADRSQLSGKETDLRDYAGVVKSYPNPANTGVYNWVNNNDFLWYVFDGYLEKNNGPYAQLEANMNYVKYIVEADGSYRYSESGGTYTLDPNGNCVKYLDSAGNEKYGVAVMDSDATGTVIDVVKFDRDTKITEDQIQFDALTPAELDSAVAADKDFLLQYDLVVIEKGIYEHLEGITSSIVGGNPYATYQTNDFKWATIEALYEYAGKLKKPFVLDSSLSGTASTNLKRLYLMVRVFPYETFRDIYNVIDHTTGALNHKYTFEDPYNLGSGIMKTETLTWDLTSITSYYLNNNGLRYSDRYSVNEKKDADGDYVVYNVEDSLMDNLIENVFLWKGEDVSLGENFKSLFRGQNKNKFTEVVDELPEIKTVDDLTTASVFKYLLNLNSRVALRHQISILEVEPSIDFKYAKVDKSGAVYKFTRNDEAVRELLILMGYLPTKKSIENVNVVALYSGALAGYKEDMLNFEYIYIGDRKGLETGHPDDNGGALKAPLYKFTEWRALDDPADFLVGNVNYTAGNDITSWMASGLMNFVNSGRVLQLGETVYSKSANTLDSKSQMGKFINSAINSGMRTVVNEKDGDAAMDKAFKRASVSPYIMFAKDGGKPTEYYDASRGAGNEYKFVTHSSTEIDAAGNQIPVYTYNYSFTVGGASDTEYKAYVYLDTNGDGRFVEYTTGDDETELVSASLTSFKTASNGKSLTQTISFSFKNKTGMIPWKLVVEEIGNPLNKHSEVGYVSCKPIKKEIINVLQLVPDADHKFDAYGTFVLDNTKTIMNETGYMETDLFQPRTRSYETKFASMINTNEDYDIRIYSVPVSEFEKWYDPAGQLVRYYQKKNNSDELFLSGYKRSAAYDKNNPQAVDYLTGVFDMVIFGFGDNYEDFKNTGDSIYNLYNFVKTGNSMLLGHDAVSYDISELLNHKKGSNKLFSRVFRDLVGQDRFGYSVEKGYIASADSDKYSAKADLIGLEGRYGYSSSLVMRYVSATSPKLYSGMEYNTNDLRVVRSTVQLNRGPITEYPYHLGKEIPVSYTHPQWFQLNLEDQDVMVWYNLAGVTDTNTQYFNNTFNDSWNSFYVYTNDNVTYTGAGHRYDESTPPTTSEMELFVNTIIAAIRATNHAPTVTVTNGSVSNSSECDYVMYVDEDSEDCYLQYIVQDMDLIEFTPIRNVKVYWDRENDGRYVASSDDMLLYEFVAKVPNDAYDEDYNLVKVVPQTGTLVASDGSKTSLPLPLPASFDLSKIWSDSTMNQGLGEGENAIYINIVAEDAKGATGTARVKIKVLDLYNLD